MKIIEALKEQKIIHAKVSRNNELIRKYSSKVSVEKPYFETDDEQQNAVCRLIQANIDLGNRYLMLKRSIDLTNATTKVEILGKTFTISDLLNLKRFAIENIFLPTYQSLSTEHAESSRALFLRQDSTRDISLVTFYKEEEKNKNIQMYRDLLDNIDSKLEIVNATTDLCIAE